MGQWAMTIWVVAFLTMAPALILANTSDLDSLTSDWGTFEPEFTEQMNNLTVATGRDAVLSCSVTNLGGHKVGWVKSDTKAIQAIHMTVVTHNPRVSVESAGPNQWLLIIKSVRAEDRGFYMAQINTDPMKSQMVYLDVTEPPDIIDGETPGELRVRENESLKMTCKARAHPPAKITWKREDGRDLHLNHRQPVTTMTTDREAAGETTAVASKTGGGGGGVSGRNRQSTHPVTSYEGQVLRITQVTKRHMGIYFCIASNGVPPTVSKRIAVTVLFPPSVSVDNQIVGVPLGSDVTVGCVVEASPKSINVWFKDDKMIANGSRQSYEERADSNGYRVRMVLTIQHFRHTDAGRYECRCENAHGKAEGAVKLHELPPLRTTTVLAPRLPVWTHLPPPSTTTTTTWTPPALHEVLTERKEGKPTIRPSVHDLTEALPSGGDGHGGRMTSVKATTLRPRHTTSNSSPNLFTRTPFHHNIIMILLLLVALVSFHSSS